MTPYAIPSGLTDDKQVLGAIGIVAVNGIDFIRKVFRAYEGGKPLVVLHSRDAALLPEGVAISEIMDATPGTGWFDEKHVPRNDHAVAQLSFTSGTEGKPKGIVLTHKNLADVIERLQSVMETDHTIREYVGVPVYYSFGFGRIRHCSAVGGRSYIPPGGFDPFEIAAMLQNDEINAISAVPSLWRILLANPDVIGELGKKVRWIEIGSQYMSRREKEAMKTLFPNARIVQHYGLTEASRTTLLDISRSTGNVLESVGRSYGNTEFRLAGDGRIQIRGPHVAVGRTRENGITPITDADGWLTTNDLGEIRDGNLFFLGRADDAINCGGIKLFPEQIEPKLLSTLEREGGIAITRVPDELRGDGILIVTEKECGIDESRIRTEAMKILSQLHIQAGDSLHFMEVEALPRTETGKIQRRRLTEHFMADRESNPSPAPRAARGVENSALNGEQQKIIAVWEEVLGVHPIPLDMTFFDLGGDSLSSLKMMLRLEKAGIPRTTARAFIEGKTIADITGSETGESGEQSAGGADERNNIALTADSINATRGLLVLWLIAIHWLPGVWERLPGMFAGMNTLLYPAYRLGTPGFALVFGLSVGFYYFHQLDHNPQLARKNIRFALQLIGGGILLLAGISLTILLTSGKEFPDRLPTHLFYSVLLYYLLAVASIPLWHKAISGFQDTITASLAASALFFATGMFFRVMLPDTESVAGVNLVLLMLKANYNYFTMTGTVMLGVSAGIHLRKHAQSGEMEKRYASTGLLLMLFGLIISLDSGNGQEWFSMLVPHLWAVQVYFGLTLLLLSAFMRARRHMNSPFGKQLNRMLGIIGILSLPMYVGHAMVIPIKELLLSLNLGYTLSLAIPMILFFTAAAVIMNRLSRVYGGAER